jgi:hypothetical protein
MVCEAKILEIIIVALVLPQDNLLIILESLKISLYYPIEQCGDLKE